MTEVTIEEPIWPTIGSKDFSLADTILSPYLSDAESTLTSREGSHTPPFQFSGLMVLAGLLYALAPITAATSTNGLPESITTSNFDDIYEGLSGVATPSARDVIEGTLQSYRNLPDNWDRYGGIAASKATVDHAIAFVRRLPATLSTPKSMLHSSGEVGLYWNKGSYYVSIDFASDGSYCYVADTPERKSDGDGSLTEDLPGDLLSVIRLAST